MSAEGLAYPGTLHPDAEVAELVDALASGASGGIPVEVRVLFSAPSALSSVTESYEEPRVYGISVLHLTF